MSSENAAVAVHPLPAKPEGTFGRPSMFHSSKQFIESGDLVILHQVRITFSLALKSFALLLIKPNGLRSR